MAGSWAGSWYLGNHNPPAGIANKFTADSANGSIPVWNPTLDDKLINISRVISSVRALFDSGVTPNSLTITILDAIGITVFAGTLSASGVLPVSPPIQVAGGMSVVCTGNTTNSAIGTVEILFL